MESDRVKVSAWILNEQTKCPHCKTYLDLWESEGLQSRVVYDWACPGCEMLAVAHRDLKESEGSNDGIHFSLVPPFALEEKKRQDEYRARQFEGRLE